MEIDATELRRRAAEVDEEHREAMASFSDDTAARVRASRRSFLRRASLAGAGGAALTVGSTVVPLPVLLGTAAAQTTTTTTSGATTSTIPPTTTIARPTDADRVIARFAAGLERAVVSVYTQATTSGVLEDDIAIVAGLFLGHHREHAAAFDALAGASGTANAAFLNEFKPRMAAAHDTKTILQIAFELEQAAAATYLWAIGELQSTDAAKLAASVLPVEAQHAVVLGESIGLAQSDYLPTFESVADAATPDKFPA